jgi:hypothetical protein
MLRPLAGDEADATGRSMEQDSVASLDTIGLADEVLSGEAFGRRADKHARRLAGTRP